MFYINWPVWEVLQGGILIFRPACIYSVSSMTSYCVMPVIMQHHSSKHFACCKPACQHTIVNAWKNVCWMLSADAQQGINAGVGEGTESDLQAQKWPILPLWGGWVDQGHLLWSYLRWWLIQWQPLPWGHSGMWGFMQLKTMLNDQMHSVLKQCWSLFLRIETVSSSVHHQRAT